MPKFSEPTIVINGIQMADAHAMTLRVAITDFHSRLTTAGELKEVLGELGVAYAQRCEEVLKAMGVI